MEQDRSNSINDGGKPVLRPDERLVQLVVSEVANLTGVSPTELPPLYDIIDPDALEDLFRRSDEGSHVRFRYADAIVTVSDSGNVDVMADD